MCQEMGAGIIIGNEYDSKKLGPRPHIPSTVKSYRKKLGKWRVEGGGMGLLFKTR